MFSGWNRFIAAVMMVSALLAGCGGGGASAPPAPAPTYTLSGKVIFGGTGVSGVKVNLASSSNTAYKSSFSDSAGEYTFTDVPNGTYIVSSADAKFGFDPLTVTVNGAATTVPDRAAFPVFSFTGKIALADGTPVSGAVVKLYKTSYTIYTIDNTFYTTRDLNGLESIRLDTAFVQSSTNEQGVYSFSGVLSDNYTIVPTSETYVFKWSRVPTRSSIGVITITESGMVYIYNPEGSGNKLSDDGSIIYNTGIPFAITGNMLDGLDFEAALPGGSGI